MVESRPDSQYSNEGMMIAHLKRGLVLSQQLFSHTRCHCHCHCHCAVTRRLRRFVDDLAVGHLPLFPPGASDVYARWVCEADRVIFFHKSHTTLQTNTPGSHGSPLIPRAGCKGQKSVTYSGPDFAAFIQNTRILMYDWQQLPR